MNSIEQNHGVWKKSISEEPFLPTWLASWHFRQRSGNSMWFHKITTLTILAEAEIIMVCDETKLKEPSTEQLTQCGGGTMCKPWQVGGWFPSGLPENQAGPGPSSPRVLCLWSQRERKRARNRERKRDRDIQRQKQRDRETQMASLGFQGTLSFSIFPSVSSDQRKLLRRL